MDNIDAQNACSPSLRNSFGKVVPEATNLWNRTWGLETFAVHAPRHYSGCVDDRHHPL